MENSNTIEKRTTVFTSEELLAHWQGHRALTRRTIEAFPEKEFFTHSIGGMRTFAELTMELLGIAAPGMKEIVVGNTEKLKEHFDHGNKKEYLLALWDKDTEAINTYWEQLKDEDFSKNIKLFGEYEGTVISSILYFIDNEIHHRGQAYVYLRSLGIEPPFFWER
ncbi:DinB family protein [Galbibacter mesophilus]|uniref:DinB family protein n=1 Tax=Galbibacter mesophilus TaxID=379069 RepID=UPI00191DBCB4|nr:DinB family protein [Galbibacter mesophilus]MCM5663455.1 DinB family protein [Galbibacter mesophilus]